MKEENYSEEKFYAGYKAIRNQFRRYWPGPLVSAVLDYLHAPTKNEMDELKKHPWLVLLFVKWVLMDEQFFHKDKSILPNGKLRQMLQATLDLSSFNRMPSDYQHYQLFFRNMAYQQFLYQVDFSLPAFSRQILLFGNLPSDHPFKRDFHEKTKLDINTFLDLSFLLLTRTLVDKQHFFPGNWFSSIEKRIGAEHVSQFLTYLSSDLASLRNYLLAETPIVKSKANEFYEETPLIKYPLLRVQGGYVSWHPKVLFRSLEHCIYDTLRALDAARFMSKFGDIFQNYIERGLKCSGLPFMTDGQLERVLPGSGKCVDFLVVDDGANIFIDAKGVEASYLGKVSHLSEVVSGKVETSITKGMLQGIETANRLLSANVKDSDFSPKDENYLLIITFKELYLGGGRDFSRLLGVEKIKEVLGDYYNEKLLIPFENIYFLNVDDFDRLIANVESGKMSISGLLRTAAKEDGFGQTKKFTLGQRIPGIKSRKNIPSFIENEFECMTKSLERYFEND